MKPIEKAWKQYREMVVPATASPTQVRETRQAFYAGGLILWQMLLSNASDEPEMTRNELKLMEAVEAEFDVFGAQFDKRHMPETEH